MNTPTSPEEHRPVSAASFPTPQGYASSTFHPPPADGSLCLPELFEYHSVHSPDHPLFVYADHDISCNVVDSDQIETKTITYSEAWSMIQRSARITNMYYQRFETQHAKKSGRANGKGSETTIPSIIGILANTGEALLVSVKRDLTD